MASRGSSTGKKGSKGGSKKGAAPRPVSARALALNTAKATNIRTATAMLAGACAGVLGLTNLWGFALYLVVYALGNLAMGALTMGFDVPAFLNRSFGVGYLLEAAGGNAVTFILLWTLVFALVHLY